MIDSAFDVSGKVALVTGASSGLGAHFAKTLAQNGAKVILAARRMEQLRILEQEITDNGGEAGSVQLDVTDASNVSNAFDAAEAKFGLVSILSNNAGIANPKPALQTDEESWRSVIDANLNGAWRVAREAGARLVNAKEAGTIVNTASILGLRVSLAQSSYASSKAAVVQLTKCLALEWARHNIRVNALCPGYFMTDLNREYFSTDHGKKYIENMPFKRLGELEELTAPFMLLASDAGSFVTGIVLPVDGGHLLSDM